MQRFFMLCGLLLPLVACSAEESVLHVRYKQKIDINALIGAAKTSCEESGRNFNIIGDASLIGKSVKDEYWSRNGLHSSYEMQYTVAPAGVCQMLVVPKMNVDYTDFSARVKSEYKRTYNQEWNGAAAQEPWSALDSLKRGIFDVSEEAGLRKESWSVKEMSEEEVSRMLTPALAPVLGGVNKAGQEVIAGFPCTHYKSELFNRNGADTTACGWTPNIDGLPKVIILKGHLMLTNAEIGLMRVAEQVELSVATPSSLIHPPTEWQHKPVGYYVKSDKTNGVWMDRKQRSALTTVQKSKLKSHPSKDGR